jgi:hypothetical protein
VIALYSLALLVSAALLFLLEPMVAKFVLPLLGSAPEVWPTTVLFFQAALLAGYGFAHATSRLSPRRQALLQLGLLGHRRGRAADRGPRCDPPESGSPVPWVLGPTRGHGGTAVPRAGGGRADGAAPANRHPPPGRQRPVLPVRGEQGGSLLGLLAYPVVVERLLGLEDQGRAWSVGYGAALVLVAASAVALSLRPAPTIQGRARRRRA